MEEDIILPVEESKKIIPREIANKIILKHRDDLAIVDCPCRIEKKTAGKKYCEPIHTCIFYGKTGVDFVTTHMPRMNGYRATREEVLKLLELQHKSGKVFTVWFKDATGYRAGVLCCCCSCCCACIEVEHLSRKKGIQGLAMTAPSGYSVSVDIERCNACGKCVKTCQYGALKIVENDGTKALDYVKDWCMGCGVCVSRCPNESISLAVDSGKGVIFDVDKMAEFTRKAISSPPV